MASQSLAIAQSKGAADPQAALDKVEQYTMLAGAQPAKGTAGGTGSGSGAGGGTMSADSAASTVTVAASPSAGIPLYQSAQELEQLSRTEGDRRKNAAKIKEITGQLSDQKFVTGYGSIGGEEFFSWLNISESLRRAGGAEWEKWNGDMNAKLLKLQNEDGTWAGHHCITGRVAVTGAAILTLLSDRDTVNTKKN
jgi:hypothetical protein